MAIATHTNKRPTVAHKKRTGQHQKQTKHYLKTYWPYIPLLTVTGLANMFISSYYGTSSASITGDLTTTRLQLWTNASSSVALWVCMLAFAAFMYVFLRHAKAWHKVVVKGEAFVLNHHAIDAALVTFALIGVIVTRAV